MSDLQLAPGSLFANRFAIERAASSGGMGTVYRAKDRYSGDIVALKLLHTDQGSSRPGDAERFTREAQLLAELCHPGIVAYVAHGQTPNGQRFLAMEWLDGEDLGQRLTRGPLTVRDCLLLLGQAADALVVAHQRGIIHRDLKPANLFLVAGDVLQVKLLDFGIARRLATSQAMTRTGTVIGTPEYMAPEQARGSRDLTPAADLFSLGCVLYECLTGQPPFVADHIAAVLVRILFEDPAPLEKYRTGIPAALSRLLFRMLAKHPEQRLADAAALQSELRHLGELPEPNQAVTLASPKPKAESFAAQEQSLFSVVLATAAEDIGLGQTMPERVDPQTAANGQALLQALVGLGCAPDFLANGTLVVTVPPLGSAHDQAMQAARAALLVKERWPEAQVSMATGRGAVHGRIAVGEVVELAARSLKTGSLPSPGRPTPGVWIDPLSAKLLEGRFTQTPQPGGALLLHEEHDVDASRPLLGKPTPCVGRDTELAILDAQLSVCIEDSEARAVLITAPPGFGKSRLRHEFLRRVDKREGAVTVLLGRGDLVSAGAPYAILGQAIRRFCGISGSEPIAQQRDQLQRRIGQQLAAGRQEPSLTAAFIGELSAVPFPDDEVPMLRAMRKDQRALSDRIRRAFLDWLKTTCQAAPVLLVLDDLQWADALTIELVEEALRELRGLPLCVLALARPEVHELFPRLQQSLKLQEIRLTGLTKKACERLIQQVLGKQATPAAIRHIVEQAAGNALFLEELIRSLAEHSSTAATATPETVVAMLQARIGRFEPGPRRAVLAAAVFGQTFWSGGVATLLGLPAKAPTVMGWLSGLIDAEVIERRADSRLVDEQEYSFRHALVRDAAYGLLTASDLITGHRLAGEFLEAGGQREAAVIAEHYQRGGAPEQAAPLFLQAGDEAARLGLTAVARQHFAAVATLADRLPPSPTARRVQAEALIKQTNVSLFSDPREKNLQRLTAAEALVSTQLEAAPDSPDAQDTRLLARAHYFMGRVNFYGGSYQDLALYWYQRALTQAQEIPDHELTATVSMALGTMRSLQGHSSAATQLLIRALDLMGQMDNELESIRARIWLGWNQTQLGKYRDGIRQIEEAEAQATRMKQPLLIFAGRLLRASCYRCGMQWSKMLEAVANLGTTLAEQGEKVAACSALSMQEWACMYLGRKEEAAAVRQELTALAEAVGGRFPASDWFAAGRAEAALLQGTSAVALRLAQEVVATSGPASLLVSCVIAERVWGASLSRLGGPLAEVGMHMNESLRIASSGDLLLETAQTELWWGRTLHERGEPAAAQPHFRKSRAIFESAGCDEAMVPDQTGMV